MKTSLLNGRWKKRKNRDTSDSPSLVCTWFCYLHKINFELNCVRHELGTCVWLIPSMDSNIFSIRVTRSLHYNYNNIYWFTVTMQPFFPFSSPKRNFVTYIPFTIYRECECPLPNVTQSARMRIYYLRDVCALCACRCELKLTSPWLRIIYWLNWWLMCRD